MAFSHYLNFINFFLGVETRKVPTFDYNPDFHYHTSAILALGLDTLRLGFCEKKIISNLLYFLSREKLAKKIFQEFNSWMIKTVAYQFFFGKIGVWVIFIIQEFKFFKIAQLFSVCQFLSWETIWENWEIFYHKIPALVYPGGLCLDLMLPPLKLHMVSAAMEEKLQI